MEVVTSDSSPELRASFEQAMLRWKTRFLVFGRDADAETLEAVETTLKLGRITIIEAKLMESIFLAEKDAESAKAAINREIAPKNLEAVKIAPLTDIHKILWTSASNILRGKPVSTRKKA